MISEHPLDLGHRADDLKIPFLHLKAPIRVMEKLALVQTMADPLYDDDSCMVG